MTEPGSGSGTGFHWRFRFRFRFRCEIQFRSSPNPDDTCLSRRRNTLESPYLMRGPQYNVAGSDVRKIFQIIGALPFLPNGDVDMAWTLLRPTLPPEMSSFADYMDYTWIGTSSRAPLFNQWSWNQWDDTLLGIPRSSNIAEGWHNGFKSLVGCFHPTIWKLLEALKLEQAITDTKFCNHLMRIEESPSSKAEEMGPT